MAYVTYLLSYAIFYFPFSEYNVTHERNVTVN